MAKKIRIRTRPIKLKIKRTVTIECFCGCKFQRTVNNSTRYVTCPRCGQKW